MNAQTKQLMLDLGNTAITIYDDMRNIDKEMENKDLYSRFRGGPKDLRMVGNVQKTMLEGVMNRINKAENEESSLKVMREELVPLLENLNEFLEENVNHTAYSSIHESFITDYSFNMDDFIDEYEEEFDR